MLTGVDRTEEEKKRKRMKEKEKNVYCLVDCLG